jgi:hypothetical protein
MTPPRAEPGAPHAHVQARRARIAERVGRGVEPLPAEGERLSVDRMNFLVREAEELYWNELGWEELTDEERVVGGHLTELVFPGLLAFVDALIQRPADRSGEGRRATHPEVVEQILLFLADQYTTATAELGRGADSERLVWARSMTSHLIDLVMYRLYGLTDEEREEVEG